MKDPIRNVVVPILILCVFFTVGGMTLPEEYFYRSHPRAPDPTSQRVHAEDVKSIHGVARVYVTGLEKIPFDHAVLEPYSYSCWDRNSLGFSLTKA